MEINELLNGFQSLLNFETIFWLFLGVTLGTLIGALPGVGPVTGIAILLPMSFTLNPIEGLVFLTGVYQGSMYGARISSILINVPGDADAVVTTFDGYPMTQKGLAGYALSLSAIASFIGGIVGFIGLIFLTPYISKIAYVFGPAEYFSLMLFALIATSGIGGKNLIKALISMAFGLLISMIGNDPIDGTPRLTFGLVELWNGVPFVIVMIGVFGLAEVLVIIENKDKDIAKFNNKIPFKDLIPNIKQIIRNTGSMIRGSVVGFLIGVLPGAGATIATFISYSLEKKVSKTPEKFGTGIDQGLSAPESANNASVGGALIPLFSLGIPGSGTAAILLGALIMYGLQPGPLMFERSSDIIWPTITALLIANVLLLILNTAFVPAFTIIVEKVQRYIVPLIATFCLIGSYMLNYSFFEVGLMIFFGVIGYLMRKSGFPLPPLVLAVVLGSMLETNFRQALLQSQNDIAIFFIRPISLVLLSITFLILIYPILIKVYKKFDNNKV